MPGTGTATAATRRRSTLVAATVPGARSVPCRANLTDDHTFLPVAELRRRFEEAGVVAGVPVVSYCGSGVTACHDLLAMELAGLVRDGSMSILVAIQPCR